MCQLILGVFNVCDINWQGENVSYIIFHQPYFYSFSANYEVVIFKKIDNKEFHRVSTLAYVLHESTNWQPKYSFPNDPCKRRSMLLYKNIISNFKTYFLLVLLVPPANANESTIFPMQSRCKLKRVFACSYITNL